MCDVSTGRPRPIGPPDFRRTAFDVVHYLSHPEVKATVKLASDKFVWRGMQKQVSRSVKECHHCQSSKVQKHTKAPLEHFFVPEKRFSHINIDNVGPLPFFWLHISPDDYRPQPTLARSHSSTTHYDAMRVCMLSLLAALLISVSLEIFRQITGHSSHHRYGVR